VHGERGAPGYHERPDQAADHRHDPTGDQRVLYERELQVVA